jgi:hypothetical protein
MLREVGYATGLLTGEIEGDVAFVRKDALILAVLSRLVGESMCLVIRRSGFAEIRLFGPIKPTDFVKASENQCKLTDLGQWG